MKRNILLKISYDGTKYSGFQRQPDQTTIESTIIKSLKKINCENVKLQYAGRTDSGVHAKANYINFRTSSKIPAKKFPAALNTNLPHDIRILTAKEVDDKFNTRYEIIERIYKYYIYTGEILPPFIYRYCFHYPFKVDIHLLNKTKKYFIGRKDFSSFRSSNCCANTTIREIRKIKIYKDENEIIIKISANAFLKNMVRIIVGTLLEINEGKIELKNLEKIIESKDRTLAGRTVSAKGLFLHECLFR